MTTVSVRPVPDGSRRRILFVTHTNEWIGPNASLVQLVVRAPSWMEPLVLLPGDGPLSNELDRRQVRYYRIRRLDKYGIPRMARLMRRESIDLVYGNSAHGASKNAMIAAKICGRPFVYHVREMCGRPRLRSTFLWRRADAFVAVSRAAADSYRPFLSRPATVVYNGVGEEHFAAHPPDTRARLRSEFGIPAEVPVVLHVGNVYQRKAQHVAVRAFQRLKQSQPDARLLLVGRLDRDPGYVRELEESIDTVDPSRHIQLTGLRGDVRDILAASDAFLHTATNDPHPRVVIEAMAAGLPIVAVAVDGVVETIVEGECGFLVEPPGNPDSLADRLDRVLRAPELGGSMGANGRERARRLFSAERTAREVNSVIERVLRTSGRWA